MLDRGSNSSKKEQANGSKKSNGPEGEKGAAKEVYIYYPPNTNDTYHEVLRIKKYDAQETQQNAFNYYMTRVKQFAHIAKIAAIDDVIFEIFVGMLANIRHVDLNIQAFFEDVLPNLYEGMQKDSQHDHQVLWRITQLYESLEICRDNNLQSISHFFDAEIKKLDQVIQRVFDSKETSDKQVVFRLLSKSTTFHRYENSIVEQASVIYHPVIRTALDMEISALFGAPQVSSFIEKLFFSNLRAPEYIKKDEDLATLSMSTHETHLRALINSRHTQSFENIRYCPAVLFFLEGFSKFCLLLCVSYSSVIEYGFFFDSVNTDGNLGKMKLGVIQTWTEFSILELMIAVMAGALFLAEIGQWESNTMERHVPSPKLVTKKSYLEGFIDNFFRDIWNFFDLVSLVLLIVWFGFKVSPTGAAVGKVLLAAAAIPQSLGMLRYFSIQKAMGNLIITVVSMSRELFAFAVIYTVSIYGFGVTLKALFQSKEASDNWYEGFGTITSTGLTLFDATIGQHDFGQMSQENTYIFYFGLFVEMVFLIFTLIILFNLLIAKMTSAYEEKQESALRDWEYARATILRQFLLRGEASPLSMLPAPFNLITAFFYLPHWLWINSEMHGTMLYKTGRRDEHFLRTSEKKCLSIAGTIADLVLCILSCPIMSVLEVMYDIREIINIGLVAVAETHRRKLKNSNDTAHRSTVLLALVQTALLLTSHVLLVILISPGTYLYYTFRHFAAVATTRVYLQFESKTDDNLIIVYPSKPVPQVARRDIHRDFFQGVFIRSCVYSQDYLHEHPIICRAICKSVAGTHTEETFQSQTGEAVFGVSGDENKRYLGKRY